MMTREQTGGALSTLVDKDGDVQTLEGSDDRARTMDEFSPWGRIIAIGAEVTTDYGSTIRPDAELQIGRRVLVGRVTPENYDFHLGGGTVTVGMTSFRGILVIDLGPEAETDETLDEHEQA